MTDATSRARAKALLTSVLDNDRFDLSADGLADFILEVFDQDDLRLYDTRTHAAVPREPSEADVSRIASVLFMCGPDMTYRDQARAAIAALVAAQTQGGEPDAPA